MILGFIGVKLVLHALHENNLPFINNGDPVDVVEISTGLSLAVILTVLTITVAASLASGWGRAQNSVASARQHAEAFLQPDNDAAYREEMYARLSTDIAALKALPEKYRARIRSDHEVMSLLLRAEAAHVGSSAASTAKPET
jgi:tellurite resistance protein TerC